MQNITRAVQGELSIFSVSRLRTEWLADLAQGDELTVDVSAVTEIDAAGVQLMIAALHEARNLGKRLVFTHANDTVVQALELCGIPFSDEGFSSGSLPA